MKLKVLIQDVPEFNEAFRFGFGRGTIDALLPDGLTVTLFEEGNVNPKPGDPKRKLTYGRAEARACFKNVMKREFDPMDLEFERGRVAQSAESAGYWAGYARTRA